MNWRAADEYVVGGDPSTMWVRCLGLVPCVAKAEGPPRDDRTDGYWCQLEADILMQNHAKHFHETRKVTEVKCLEMSYAVGVKQRNLFCADPLIKEKPTTPLYRKHFTENQQDIG
jgi:hypothetical protein